MARRRPGTNDAARAHPEGESASENTRFVTDEGGGVTVELDGHPQSHVSLDDPELLVFEYVQQLAACLDTLAPGPLAVTHVGGAGLTLARYLQHTRPGSAQIVLEPHTALTDAVRRELPLPRGHRIRVRGVDGAAGLPALRDASADAVVVDAFAGGRVPAELTAPAFLTDAARVLSPTGLLLVNLTDEPGMRYVARVVATARETPARHVALIAATDVFKGRRFGNVVLVASRAPLDVDAIGRRLARCPFPAALREEAATARLGASARPFTDTDAQPSPPPPDPGRWRVR